jgi:hypothetical protein
VGHWGEKVRVAVGDVSLELPAALVQREEANVDSSAGVFEGSGLTVIVDQGPFSDPLDSHTGRPGYREEPTELAAVAGRTISYQTPEEGTYTVAAHLPPPAAVTVVVRADGSVPEHVPREIIASIRAIG